MSYILLSLKKKVGIKRSINKIPLSCEDVNSIFYKNHKMKNTLIYLIQIFNENKIDFLKKVNIIPNPNKILMIEFTDVDLNIVKYDSLKYNIIGLFNILNNNIVPDNLCEEFYVELCESLNNISGKKFFYKKNISLCEELKREIIQDFKSELEKITYLKNYKLEKSLLDLYLSDLDVSFESRKLKYYLYKDYNKSYINGIALTVINKIFGKVFKEKIKIKDVEGFVYYDNLYREYIKIVGDHIDFYKDSKFNQKILAQPLMPFSG